LVAATARSGPASSSITWSVAAASSEVGSFVIPTVSAPWRRASPSTATSSGDCPDCEIPSTTACETVEGHRRASRATAPRELRGTVPSAEDVLSIDRGVVGRAARGDDDGIDVPCADGAGHFVDRPHGTVEQPLDGLRALPQLGAGVMRVPPVPREECPRRDAAEQRVRGAPSVAAGSRRCRRTAVPPGSVRRRTVTERDGDDGTIRPRSRPTWRAPRQIQAARRLRPDDGADEVGLSEVAEPVESPHDPRSWSRTAYAMAATCAGVGSSGAMNSSTCRPAAPQRVARESRGTKRSPGVRSTGTGATTATRVPGPGRSGSCPLGPTPA